MQDKDMSLSGISVNENVNDSQMTGQYNEVMIRLILERWTLGEVQKGWVDVTIVLYYFTSRGRLLPNINL